MSSLHDTDTAALARLSDHVARFVTDRLAHTPLGRHASPTEMDRLLHGAITDAGLGTDMAWSLFTDAVVPNNIGLASERFLAFIPVSPTPAGVWMDAAVSAANFSAESWLEAAGAVAAENQTLDWLAGLIGLPTGAGGCFMSGGSIGNLSALAVARDQAAGRCGVAVGDTAHASVRNALHLLGLEAVVIPTGTDGRFTGAGLTGALSDSVTGDSNRGQDQPEIGIVCAAGGSTNAGVVDDLAGLADISADRGLWLHVDAAYGGAALLVDETRRLFTGIERADSVIIDPHKWLFGPAGSCALLYREPALAAAVHTQRGPYIDVLHDAGLDDAGLDDDDRERGAWNPSDYGFQLTRRAAGLPLWFTLVSHGIAAHRAAIQRTLTITRQCAARFAALPGVDLVMEPQLGVILFRRAGWGRADWRGWAKRLLDGGVAFVAPTTWRDEPVGRLVFMHPNTPESLIDELAESLL